MSSAADQRRKPRLRKVNAMAITLPKLKTENKTISAFIVPMIFVIHLHTFIGNTMSKNFLKTNFKIQIILLLLNK